MNAVVVRVTFNDVEAAETMLNQEVVPMVKEIPGFVAGWWTRALDKSNGLGVMIFDSEETAQGVKQRLESQEGAAGNDAVNFQGAEVREVVANA